jgi:DNA processing protein
MDHERLTKLLALTFWKGMGPRSWKKLVERFGDPLNFFAASKREQNEFKLLRSDPLAPPNLTLMLELADREIELSRMHGFGILALGDERYSFMLASIPDPPPVLYYKGDTSLLSTPCLAIVGTRHPTPYGLDITQRIGRDISRSDLTIVSGLAVGIDATAHQSAIDETGKTIAILGCGLDQRYPSSNLELRSKIENKGLVLTEFPWGTEPKPKHFPRRNRIISGLSLGVLLVEARERSGALFTIGYALDQGRDVFAIPGRINSPASRGVLRLIQQGAIPVMSVEDILQHLPQYAISNRVKPIETIKNNDPPEGMETRYFPIWKLMSSEPVSVDDLIAFSGLAAPEIHSALLHFELEGWVTQLPGKRYYANLSGRYKEQ